MTQLQLFDTPTRRKSAMQAAYDAAGEGEAAKREGMAKAVEKKKSLLEFARKIARELAQSGKAISMDDVQLELVNRGISISALGNAAGPTFLNGEWERVGEIKSIRKHSHRNKIGLWVLKDA